MPFLSLSVKDPLIVIVRSLREQRKNSVTGWMRDVLLPDDHFLPTEGVSIGGSEEGGQWDTSPSWSNFFDFHAVFGKNLAKL